MGKSPFWSRVGGLFRPSAGSSERFDAGEDAGRGALGSIGSAGASEDESGHAASRRGLARRDSQGRECLEDGLLKVVGLVESIQSHFDRQDERVERMANSLDRVADGLAPLAETSQGQLDSLKEICDRLQTLAGGTKRLEDSLSELPHIADAQRETMVGIGRQLDVLREGGEKNVESLEHVNEVVARFAEATDISTTTIKHLHADSASREDRMADFMQEQTKRLSLLAWSAISLAGVAAVVSLVAVFR